MLIIRISGNLLECIVIVKLYYTHLQKLFYTEIGYLKVVYY